jgi:hypothetical protein
VDPTDGSSRVVSSGGNVVDVWKLETSTTATLTNVAHGLVSTGQSGGFFTSISSNGTASPIIWALSRPTSTKTPSILLYAFNPDSGTKAMTTLFRSPAGSWPNQGGDSNQVPTIANGKVYIASDKTVRIFGLKSGSAQSTKK